MKKMTSLINDASIEIPGYKSVLKTVIKCQIQQLVEQLATNTDEESVFLTVSVSDGSISHLGTDNGREFLKKHEDVKLQFLGFCLKNHYEKKLELQRQETESYLYGAKTSFMSQSGETYTATKYDLPTAFNIANKTTLKLPPRKSRARLARVRFKPYSNTSLKQYENNQFTNFQEDIESQEPEFNILSKNCQNEEYGEIKDFRKTDEKFEESQIVDTAQGISSDSHLVNASQSESNGTEHTPEANYKYVGQHSEQKVGKVEQKPNWSSCVNENEADCNYENEIASTSCKNARKDVVNNINEDQSPSSINTRQNIVTQEDEAYNIVQVSDGGSMDKSMGNDNEKESLCSSSNFQDSPTFDSETYSTLNFGFTKNENLSHKPDSKIVTDEQNTNSHSTESNISKMRISKSLLRRYEVNNALKMSSAKRANNGYNVILSADMASVENIDCEDVELQQKCKMDTQLEGKSNQHKEIVDLCISDGKEEGIACIEESESHSPLCVHDTDSESELEIVAIEPGSVFVFKDNFYQEDGVKHSAPCKRERVTKYTRKCRSMSRVNKSHVYYEVGLETNTNHKMDQHDQAKFTKLRKIKTSPDYIKQNTIVSKVKKSLATAEQSTVSKMCASEVAHSTTEQSTDRKSYTSVKEMASISNYDDPGRLNQIHFPDSISHAFRKKSGRGKRMQSKLFSNVQQPEEDVGKLSDELNVAIRKKKKIHRSDLGFVDNSRTEVIKNKRGRNILKQKTLFWTDLVSNRRSKHLRRQTIKNQKKRLSEDEERKESDTHIYITDQVEAATGNPDLRRNSNHVLPSIFTKLSLDPKPKSLNSKSSNGSVKNESDLSTDRISLQENNMSKEELTNSSIKQRNNCCVIAQGYNHTKVQKDNKEDNKSIYHSNDRNNILHTVPQEDLESPHSIKREYIKRAMNDRQKLNKDTDVLRRTDCKTSFSKDNRKHSGVSTSENKGDFTNDKVITNKQNHDTLIDNVNARTTAYNTKTSNTLGTINQQIEKESSPVQQMFTDRHVRNRKKDNGVDSISEQWRDNSNNKHPSNDDAKEAVFKTKPVSVTLKSLTETISSVTSSLLSSTQFSFFKKSPSSVVSSKSSSSVSSTLSSPCVYKPLSNSTSFSPSYNQSDSSFISHSLSPEQRAESKIKQDVRNESQANQMSFENESQMEIKIETSSKVSKNEKETTAADTNDAKIIDRNEKSNCNFNLSYPLDTSSDFHFTCDTCDKIFQCKSTLSEHISSHTGEITRFEDEARERVPGHEGKNMYKIEVKRLMFEENIRLKEDDFSGPSKHDKSDEIDKVTLNSNSLHRNHKAKKKRQITKKYVMENRSIFRSRKPRRFLCLFCGKKFSLKASLEKHVRWDHITEIHSTCSSCGSNITTTRPNINLTKGDISDQVVKRSDSKCSFGFSKIDCTWKDKGLNKNEEALCESCKYSLHSDTDSQSDTDVKNQTEKISSSIEGVNMDDTKRNQTEFSTISKRAIANDLCEKTFSSDKKEELHIRTEHYGELFECKECRKSFAVETNYRQHVFEIHTQKG